MEEEKYSCKICKKESARPFRCGELCWDCYDRIEQLKKDLEYLKK